MRGLEDRPHGMAFYGTEAALFIDRIGMELYPEPKPPDGGRRGGCVFEPRMEKIKMNEDEPSPLHTNYFVDYVRSRKVPFAQHWGGSAGYRRGMHGQRGVLDRPEDPVGRPDIQLPPRQRSQRPYVPSLRKP
jgi:hypothetical protein